MAKPESNKGRRRLLSDFIVDQANVLARQLPHPPVSKSKKGKRPAAPAKPAAPSPKPDASPGPDKHSA